MPDPQSNILAELEASAVLLGDLAGCAVRLEGAERAQVLSAMPGQVRAVNKLLAASQRLGSVPPRRRRVSRWRLAMPTDPPVSE